jgi:hypothetical protein
MIRVSVVVVDNGGEGKRRFVRVLSGFGAIGRVEECHSKPMLERRSWVPVTGSGKP